MKFLILNYEYPPLGGGAGVVSKYHAEGLAELGHEVLVLTTWYKGEKEIETNGRITIKRLKSRRKYDFKSTPDEWISWITHSKKFLKKYLQENTFDFCFAHFALPGGEVAKYIHSKFNISYAVISHGQDIPWFFPKQMFKYHLLTYFWIKRICNKADKLILLTKDMKKNADRFLGKHKHKNIIIPNGCNTKIFKPDYDLRQRKFKILFIGRLVDQKAPFIF
jgi:glycosyltransferase involved in cell wall biosynthesis